MTELFGKWSINSSNDKTNLFNMNRSNTKIADGIEAVILRSHIECIIISVSQNTNKNGMEWKRAPSHHNCLLHWQPIYTCTNIVYPNCSMLDIHSQRQSHDFYYHGNRYKNITFELFWIGCCSFHWIEFILVYLRMASEVWCLTIYFTQFSVFFGKGVIYTNDVPAKSIHFKYIR